MSLSMYQASVPVFTQILGALSNVLDKAEAHAAAKKIDPAVLIAARLFPDMLPFGRQLHIACDFAKARNSFRLLAGKSLVAIIMIGEVPMPATGVRSLFKSNGSLG